MEHTADERAAADLRAVHDQIQAILDRHGVTRIGAAGEPFDPSLHEAVGVHPTGEVPDRAIADVAQPGYAVGDRVVRPAQVIVARRPQPET
jgi:molecular chaperone GrpE